MKVSQKWFGVMYSDTENTRTIYFIASVIPDIIGGTSATENLSHAFIKNSIGLSIYQFVKVTEILSLKLGICLKIIFFFQYPSVIF